MVPVSALVAAGWRLCTFKSAPRPVPAFTSSVLIQAERRYLAAGSTGTVIPQLSSAPFSDAIITLCEELLQKDCWAIGRTVEAMGIDPRWSIETLKRYLRDGTIGAAKPKAAKKKAPAKKAAKSKNAKPAPKRASGRPAARGVPAKGKGKKA